MIFQEASRQASLPGPSAGCRLVGCAARRDTPGRPPRPRVIRTAEDVAAGMGSFSPEPWLPRPLSPSGLVLAAALLLLVLCLRVRRTR